MTRAWNATDAPGVSDLACCSGPRDPIREVHTPSSFELDVYSSGISGAASVKVNSSWNSPRSVVRGTTRPRTQIQWSPHFLPTRSTLMHEMCGHFTLSPLSPSLDPTPSILQLELYSKYSKPRF